MSSALTLPGPRRGRIYAAQFFWVTRGGGGGGLPLAGHTQQSGKPDCRGPEAKQHIIQGDVAVVCSLVWPFTVCHCPPSTTDSHPCSTQRRWQPTFKTSAEQHQVTAAHLACSHCWRAGNCQPARLALGCTPRWPSSAQSQSSAPETNKGQQHDVLVYLWYPRSSVKFTSCIW